MDKLIVKQPTAQIASPCVKPKLEKTPKSILRVSEKQMYVTPAKKVQERNQEAHQQVTDIRGH